MSDRNSILEPQMADHSLYCILRSALGLLYKSYSTKAQMIGRSNLKKNLETLPEDVPFKSKGEGSVGWCNETHIFPLKEGGNRKI